MRYLQNCRTDEGINRFLQTKMSRTYQEYLNTQRTHASQAVAFLSNPMEPERDRSVCRAFLRSLGVSFNDDELISRTADQTDVDVEFRDARFQVLAPPDHNRHEYWKKKQRKYQNATLSDDTTVSFSPPIPIRLHTLIPKITELLKQSRPRKIGQAFK